MNHRIAAILRKLPKKEHITIVAVVARLPVLMQGNTIVTFFGRMPRNFDCIEGNLDIFVIMKRFSQVVEILLLVLSAIHDFWSERSLVVAHVLAHDDFARDNQGIVAIHVS